MTIDVEWAHPTVLADLIAQLNQRGLRATVFCTHPDIQVPGHERALHPNFRRNGDTMRRLRRRHGPLMHEWSDADLYHQVITATHAYCPEAIGTRSHSLFSDSALLPVYQRAGLQYKSNTFLPLASHVRPVRRRCNLLEMPIYYMDHADLAMPMSGFRLSGLRLDQPGLKVFDFHPNLVYINAASEAHYHDSRGDYHNPEQLRRRRYTGRGVRDLWLELLDEAARRRASVMTLGELNAAYRQAHPRGVAPRHPA